MGKISKFTLDEKERMVKFVLDDRRSFYYMYKEFKIDKYTLKKWVRRYKILGRKGLEDSINKIRHSKEVKLNAITDYKKGLRKSDIIEKYDLASESLLKSWIKKYNSLELKELKRSDFSVTIGRKAIFEEKLEAVKHCLEHNKNYQETSEMYNISYSQIYSWVKKYEKNGEKGLEDKRGKRKKYLTKEGKLKLNISKLKYENKKLKAENLLLKKLKELKRR